MENKPAIELTEEKRHGVTKDTALKYTDEIKKESEFIIWFKQLYIMLKTDAILTFIRYWKSTVITILAPIIFLLLLYIIQELAATFGIPEVLHPQAYTLPGVVPCTKGDFECATIMFTPDDPTTRKIMEIFHNNNKARIGSEEDFSIKTLDNVETNFEKHEMYVSVPSETLMYDYILAHPNVTEYGISFKFEGNRLAYQMWFNASLTSNTTQSISEYFAIELTSLMRGVDEAIIHYLEESNGLEKTVFKAQLKDWPTYASEGISQNIVSQIGPMFFFCCSMINFLLILNTVVSEKEYKLRHGMQMMGLKPSVYWTSWLLINTVIIIFSSLVTCLFGLAFRFEFFTNTEFRVLYILFFAFSFSMIFFAFFVSTLVRRVSIATLIGIFILIIGLVFMFVVFASPFVASIFWEEKTNIAGWLVLMFLPFFNFGKLYSDIALLSVGSYSFVTDTLIRGPGFNWSDLYKEIPAELTPRFGTYDLPLPVRALNLLIVDMFFYALLTWYLDNVIPDEFGNSRPFYFFLTPSYWGFKIFKTKKNLHIEELLEKAKTEDEDEDVHQERLKTLNSKDEEAVRLYYLRKVYNGGLFKKGESKVAVHGSCWSLEEGKLLALLGQNGAGKSTTINMLCGFSKPTSGDAFMFGKSIASEMSELRSMMGVCPQHDILFRDLTAKEHIELFAGIKNVPRDQVEGLVKDRLEAVRLNKVQNKCAGTYSGGMKRRLSVAISTIGNPKIIFMDEPTTGMDPVNRRYVWSFIEHFKKGRVIILTTHSMEEADILGDQIAIMALGKLRAFGTSIHLKGRFGAGYRISLVSEEERSEIIKKEVAERIPGIILEDDSAGALIFKIPKDSFTHIPEFVKTLESGEIQGVREWGISQATLEEVFLKLIREVNPTKNKK